MTMLSTLLVALAVAAGALGLAGATAWLLRRDGQIEARIRLIQHRDDPGARPGAQQFTDLLTTLRRFGMFIIQTGILSKKSIADLEQTLAAGGFRSASALPLVIGSKVALLFVLPLAAWALSVSLGVAHGSTKMMMFCGAAAIALLAPERIVSHLRNRYLGEVERSLPDALDLLVICADAGLPLEAALERVAAELRNGSAPTANELALTASEMKLLPDRRQALVNLGTRTGLETLVSLGGTLAQTLKYGTPITQALRVLSNDLRHVMLTRYEERAARLPVLLTLPMIGFFVPCVLLIVAGPAAVQVYHMLSHT